MDRASRVSPIGDHAGEQPKIVHAVHDNAAELRLAKAALHVVVVEVQRVVVERGFAEKPDRLAGHGEARPFDGLAGLQIFERRHLSPHTGRMVQPRPEQITSPRWLKKTLSCTTNSRSRLMNLSSARASSRMVSFGRAGML